LILAASTSACALLLQRVELLNMTAGALVGIVVSPDLDVDVGNVSGKILGKVLGNFWGVNLWRRFWKLYSTSFKHGRFASHFPVFSTIVRLWYIYFFVILIPHIVIYFLIRPSWDLMYVLTFYAMIFAEKYFLAGLIASDVIHYALDVLTKNKD
jgi:uncharacterized metal-binding protein